MADNFNFTPGSGATGAADDIGGVLYPRVKLTQGADGSATDVSSAAPLEVTLAHTGANSTPVAVSDGSSSLTVDDGGESLTVDGTITANIGTSGSLALDATLTGGTQQTKITNGTTVADTLTGDTGQNSLLVAGTREEVSFTTTTVQAVGSTDVSNYRYVSVQITSQGTSSTVTFQGSNNNSTWVSTSLLPSTAVGATVPAVSSTTTGLWHGPVNFRYFRLNVTGISAGTTAGTIELFSVPPTQLSSSVSVSSITSAVVPGTAATNLGKAEDAVAASGDTGVAVLAVRRDTPSSDVSAAGDYATLQVSSSGELWVNANSTLPSNIKQLNGNTISVGNGTSDTGTQRVSLASDSTGNIATIGTSVTPGTSAAHLGKAEDAAHSSGDTGVAMLAVRTDTPATTSSATGDYDVLHTNATGQLQTALYPDTVGGITYSWNSIKATATSVKSSAGQVYGWYIYNSNSSAVYVQFFNTASGSVTLGTTTPVYSLGIPATAGANVFIPHGIAHSTAITIAATTTSTGSSAPTNNVDINVFYK